ncbi:hypothetical protein KI387_018018, partial [Taxus chinensis]
TKADPSTPMIPPTPSAFPIEVVKEIIREVRMLSGSDIKGESHDQREQIVEQHDKKGDFEKDFSPGKSLKEGEVVDVDIKELRRSPYFKVDKDKDETIGMSYEEIHMDDTEKIPHIEIETQYQETQLMDTFPSVE